MAKLPRVPENWLEPDDASADEKLARQDNGGSPNNSQPEQTIGPVRGYPETGTHSWRAANDPAIIAATAEYNGKHNYLPGDQEYMSPQLMKAWMMRESGGSPHDFKSDPFQVNNWADWDAKKKLLAGLKRGQAMTPRTSADAALKWLHYKGCTGDHGKVVPYQGHYEALKQYNGAPGYVNGIPKKDDYAHTIINRARESYGDWKQ